MISEKKQKKVKYPTTKNKMHSTSPQFFTLIITVPKNTRILPPPVIIPDDTPTLEDLIIYDSPTGPIGIDSPTYSPSTP